MGFCYIACIFIVILLLFYVSLEVHYFLRMTLGVLLARFCRKRINIMDESSVTGICFTTDIDTYLYHMNNARFIRELDFAKMDFYERTGLFKCVRSKGGKFAMAATTIRYRRFVKLFSRYRLTSRIVYWDERTIFMEHRFINPSDQFINAIVLTRTRLIGCNVNDVMDELLHQQDVEGDVKLKPVMAVEVAKWCEYNSISSSNLRIESS